MAGSKLSIICGFLFVLVQGSMAQFQPKNLIRHWSIQEGLSQGVVNRITQDDQSLMWFATEDGLNRFDGYSFSVFRYDPDLKSSIADNYISNIFKDSEGILWVSSRKGLLKFDPDVETFTLFQHDFENRERYTFNDVSFITEGAAGNLWIGWYGSGFASFDRSTHAFVPYTPETLPGLTSEKTIAVLEDKYGLLWVGTQDGGLNIFKVSQGTVVDKLERLPGSSMIPAVNIHCLAEDKLGNIWIGTSLGLVVYLRQEGRFFSFDDKQFSTSGVNVVSLLADSNENLWVGLQGGGLYQLDLRQFNNRTLDDFIVVHIRNLSDFDISKRTIQSIYEDREKNLWVGTFGDGVYLMSNIKENFVKIQKPLYQNMAVSFLSYYGMCHDQEGNLWLGTDGNGIYKSDPSGNTLRHFTRESECGLEDNAILSALCDQQGRLWFGTFSKGLFLYDKATDSFVNYRYQSPDKAKAGGNDVRVIFEDSNRNLWIGTNRGGLCLLNEEGNFYSNPSHFSGALLDGDIRSITEDDRGNIWIGLYGDGIYSYSPATGEVRRHFNASDSRGQLKSDIVFAVNADKKGNIWLGTGGSGISVYNTIDNKFRRYTEKDGLSNNTVYAILVDNAYNVWLSTNAGISKFDTREDKFYNYKISDGLQEGQFNPGSALYNQMAGYMAFGGTLGLNTFFPDQVKEVLTTPEVMLTGFALFNRVLRVNDSIEGTPVLTRVINRTKHIVLRHYQNVVTFEFIGLNYSYPEKNVYSYQLEGLDEDWNYVGDQRSATYRYLAPGEYTFKVRASTVGNAWTDEFASVSIEIKPPFWKTPWAYLLYCGAIFCMGFVIYSFRKKQLSLRRRLKIERSQRKRDRLLVKQKMAFFTEVSHEFKTPLTLIIGPLEEMMEKEPAGTPDGKKLKLVHRNAHKLLSLINKLLDYRKFETGNILLKVREENIVAFAGDVCNTFREMASHRNINFEFRYDESVIMMWYDKEKMEMVLNNIISNSFKYLGKGNEIVVHISRQITERYPQGRVAIRIRDNGIGIPRKHLGNIFDWFHRGENSGSMSSGIGLSLAKKLVHLHKGEIFVDSVEGKGSTFSIKIPLGKEHFRPEEIVVQSALSDAGRDITAADEGITAGNHTEVSCRKGFKSLLLIEDDEEILEFLKDYFENDYRIFEATNGKEGLAMGNDHHPDLIISDIMMPEMDGIDFCREVKNNIRTCHIPVILLTARASYTHHKEGVETGADAYVTKPFSPEILRLTVHNLLQSQENLMRHYRNLFAAEGQGTKNIALNPLNQQFLKSIYEMLQSNLDKPDFNVNELCEVLNMSRSLVYKKVKMLTGLSPVEYIRSLRMLEAAKLLRTRQYKIFEVMYMVGFSDVKYFRQCFTKEFGYSPSEFMKQPAETR